jgi:hypothetical protein
MNTINVSTTDLNSYTVADLQTIMAAAKTAANDASVAHLEARGEHAYCGFAWVNIHGIKGNTKLGKRMKAAGYEKDYSGAYSIWNPSGLGTQCMNTKEVGADAAAKVFKACGFTAYAGSRAD